MNQSLIDKFQNFFDDNTVTQENIPAGLRTYIVAPDSDANLQNIVNWLKEKYKVPIDFVPFTLYKGSGHEDILLEIATLPDRPDNGTVSGYEWQGDWFFNTNETDFPGDYENMFNEEVIVTYGWGPDFLKRDQRVFAYVNQKGILAVGIVDGKVVAGETVSDRAEVFRLKVQWREIVDADKGVTTSQVKDKFDRQLPVRNSLCKLDPAIADWVAEELRHRA